MDRWYNEESTTQEGIAGNDWMRRRDFFKLGISVAGAVGTGVGFSSIAAAAQRSERTSGPLDAASEAKKIAFDRIGNGEKVLLISGFPQTRRSWNRLIPLLSPKFQTIPADLPSFGDSGILSAPATTENVARVFHEFVAKSRRAAARRRSRFWRMVCVQLGASLSGRFQVAHSHRGRNSGRHLTERHSALRLQEKVELHLPDASRFAGRTHQRERGHLRRMVVQEQGVQAGSRPSARRSCLCRGLRARRAHGRGFRLLPQDRRRHGIQQETVQGQTPHPSPGSRRAILDSDYGRIAAALFPKSSRPL